MKKLNGFLIFFICSVIHAQAQFSVLGGISGATINDHGYIRGEKPIWRGHFGCSIEYSSLFDSSRFSLETQLLFYWAGYRQDQYNTQFRIHTNYFAIPVLLNYYAGSGITLKAGLQPGWNFSVKVSPFSDNEGLIDKKASIPYESFLLSGLAGIDWRFHKMLSVYTSASYSLNSILKGPYVGKYGNFEEIPSLQQFVLHIGLKIILSDEI